MLFDITLKYWNETAQGFQEKTIESSGKNWKEATQTAVNELGTDKNLYNISLVKAVKKTRKSHLIQSLINKGYNIKNFVFATPQTNSAVYLDDNIEISYDRDGMMVGQELSTGSFYFYPLRRNLEDIFKDIERARRFEVTAEKVTFHIEGRYRVTGFNCGEKWNGWARPYFTKEECDQLCAMPEPLIRYDPVKDEYISTEYAGDDSGNSWPGYNMMVNGTIMKIWTIGAGLFVWEIEKPDNK
jgi:hypothetical protein